MNKAWDGSLSGLTPEYLSAVLVSMSQHGPDATVSFGILGTGARPNYQIENGKTTTAYNSINHQPDPRSDDFDLNNLSRQFTRDEIEMACREKPRSEKLATELLYAQFKSTPQNRLALPNPTPAERALAISMLRQGTDPQDAIDKLIALRSAGTLSGLASD